MELESRDLKILELLQQNCQASNAEVADAVGLSASSYWRRVRALEKSGVIEGYGARVNPALIGLTFEAIVHVQLTRHDPDAIVEFIAAMRNSSEVQECFATTGEADYHLRVLTVDIEAFNRFLDTFLFRLPAVASAKTNVVLKPVKRRASIGVLFQSP